MTRQGLFWTLQGGGWAAYYTFHTILYTPYGMYGTKDWLLYSLTYIIGILCTLGLRSFYRKASERFEKLVWLPVIVITGAGIATAIWYFLDMYFSQFFWENAPMELRARLQPMYMLNYNYLFFVILISWSSLYFGIKYALNWQEEKKRHLEAQMMAHKAQMKMLRYQLNPHFLFNSLNSIHALVDENTENAKEMITELSEFLRYSLLHKEATFVNLKTEVEAIKHYFSIEKKRFEEKIQIDYDLDEGVKEVKILAFLLHPLIENAVKYGMQTSTMPLRIKLTARRNNYGLLIQVCNSGKWIDRPTSAPHNGTGTGLCNVKERLANAYANNHLLNIEKNKDNTCISIQIKELLLEGE